MPRTTSRSKPVCKTCSDTHRMKLSDGAEGGDFRLVMCTRCPVPCQRCRAGGNGPYCETTPCSCSCHVGLRGAPPQHIDEVAVVAIAALGVPLTVVSLQDMTATLRKFMYRNGA